MISLRPHPLNRMDIGLFMVMPFGSSLSVLQITANPSLAFFQHISSLQALSYSQRAS